MSLRTTRMPAPRCLDRRGGSSSPHRWRRGIVAAAAGAMIALASGCQSTATSAGGTAGGSAVMTRDAQQAMTPQAARARLAEGNARFVRGESERRDYLAQVQGTAMGQYPFAVVLACIDSRSAPEIVFDQGIGDLFVPRVAGNYVQADLLGSMEFACKAAGSRLVVVMGHTECGAIKGACDDVELGNLTTVIQALRPTVDDVQGVPGPRSSANGEFVMAVTEENVRRNVAKVRSESPILRELEQSGQIAIIGAMYDVGTGQVTFLD